MTKIVSCNRFAGGGRPFDWRAECSQQHPQPPAADSSLLSRLALLLQAFRAGVADAVGPPSQLPPVGPSHCAPPQRRLRTRSPSLPLPNRVARTASKQMIRCSERAVHANGNRNPPALRPCRDSRLSAATSSAARETHDTKHTRANAQLQSRCTLPQASTHRVLAEPLRNCFFS